MLQPEKKITTKGKQTSTHIIYHCHMKAAKTIIFLYETGRLRKSSEMKKNVYLETHHYRLQEQENILRQEGHWSRGQKSTFTLFQISAQDCVTHYYTLQIVLRWIYTGSEGQRTPMHIFPGSGRVLVTTSEVGAAQRGKQSHQSQTIKRAAAPTIAN